MIVGLNTWFSDIIFTSAFPDLELVSDQNWERLELWAGERSIFSVYLCANENGLIYLTDLGQVMEQYMIENRLPFASFSLRESPERPEDPFRRDFVAVFSSYFWDDYAESFIAQNFLTTLSAKQISSSAYDMVAFISKKGENITVRHHVVFYADGILGTMDWENEGTEEKDIAQHDINVSAMNYEAEIQESYPDKEIKLLSFSVSVGPSKYYLLCHRSKESHPDVFHQRIQCVRALRDSRCYHRKDNRRARYGCDQSPGDILRPDNRKKV